MPNASTGARRSSISERNVFTPFFRRFQNEGKRELEETIALYNEAKAAYEQSGYNHPYAIEGAIRQVTLAAREKIELSLGYPTSSALEKWLRALLEQEQSVFGWRTIDWDTATLSLAEMTELRNSLRAKLRFLTSDRPLYGILIEALVGMYNSLAEPLAAVSTVEPSPLSVPLYVFIPELPTLIERTLAWITDDTMRDTGLCVSLKNRMYENMCRASGQTPYEEHRRPLAMPSESRLPTTELITTFLGGTPYYDLLLAPLPFTIPDHTRFEHHWIVAGSGHGKTQAMQSLILKDLSAVARKKASVIVIDSQGDLIRNIAELKEFAPGQRLHGKLVLVDPTDIEYPVALNLFDVGMDRINAYSLLDRERLINGVLELYDFVLASLLSAGLTQKQGLIFRYITRLMLHIPNATIHTFRELMETGGDKKYRSSIAKLTGTARAFFETEFNTREFEDTKRQVVRRLWGILENQTFERMFSHPRNKLDLFAEMNAGKVILINTAKELLKQNGTEIFGRFFVAMLAQAAQERATLDPRDRTPTFVYIDECQDYLDANVSLILEQARKFNIGMVLAHQYIGQLSPKLLESFSANTSIKFAGGVSDRDARSLASMLRTTPEFVEEQRKGSFAAFVRHTTPNAVSLQFPLGELEARARMTEAEQRIVRAEMRERYAVHYTQIGLQAEDEPQQGEAPVSERQPPEARRAEGSHHQKPGLRPKATPNRDDEGSDAPGKW